MEIVPGATPALPPNWISVFVREMVHTELISTLPPTFCGLELASTGFTNANADRPNMDTATSIIPTAVIDKDSITVFLLNI